MPDVKGDYIREEYIRNHVIDEYIGKNSVWRGLQQLSGEQVPHLSEENRFNYAIQQASDLYASIEKGTDAQITQDANTFSAFCNGTLEAPISQKRADSWSMGLGLRGLRLNVKGVSLEEVDDVVAQMQLREMGVDLNDAESKVTELLGILRQAREKAGSNSVDGDELRAHTRLVKTMNDGIELAFSIRSGKIEPDEVLSWNDIRGELRRVTGN